MENTFEQFDELSGRTTDLFGSRTSSVVEHIRCGANTEIGHTELAKVLGIGVRTLDRLVADSIITPKSRGRAGRTSTYLLALSIQAYVAYVTQEKTVPAARARREETQARLSELKLAKQLGQLIERDQVVREGQEFCRALSAKIRALPRRLIQEGILPRDRESGAVTLVHDLLVEISSWKTIEDVNRAAS